MHNLGTVIRFELVRTLKKKSFWIMAFGFPVMMAVIFGIIFMSNKATNDAVDNMSEQQFSVAITDESKLINPAATQALKAQTVDSKQQGIDRVKSGKLDAYFYYPADVSSQSVEVYGKDVGLFDNGKYNAVAEQLLSASVEHTVSPQISSVIAGKVDVQSTVFKDGERYDAFREMIVPGVFLVLFYLIISFFGNQMLTSTVEEKENRVIEMILTTIQARTLIIGKIISLIALGLFQAILVAVPALVGYLLLHDKLNMPAFDLSQLAFDWQRITIAAGVFLASFLLYTGLLVAIGAAVPTAKEAGSFIGLIMMLLFGPLYAASLFVSNPDSPFVQVMSYFPLTAPIPLLLRNAVGTLPVHEGLIAIAILLVSAAFVMHLAVRTFQFGALQYSRKLTFKEIFARK